jgi:hypothetical protein
LWRFVVRFVAKAVMHKVTQFSLVSGGVYEGLVNTALPLTAYLSQLESIKLVVRHKITVSFVGFSNFEDSDVYLQLGENKTFKINLLKSQIN